MSHQNHFQVKFLTAFVIQGILQNLYSLTTLFLSLLKHRTACFLVVFLQV
ncbi:hypothetical protein RDABS01_025550 [Bienertia sinuspersici]